MTDSRSLGTVRRDVLVVSAIAVAASPAIQFAWIVVLDGLGLDGGLPDASFVLGPAAMAATAAVVGLYVRHGRVRTVAYGFAAFLASAALLAHLYATLPIYNL